VMSTALGKVTTTYYSNKQQNICSIATSKKWRKRWSQLKPVNGLRLMMFLRTSVQPRPLKNWWPASHWGHSLSTDAMSNYRNVLSRLEAESWQKSKMDSPFGMMSRSLEHKILH
jgi:hypothetical protein